MKMQHQLMLWGTAMCFLHASPAAAQSAAQQLLKGKTIRILVPYAAGGSTDAISRRLALDLGREFETNAVVENRSGGNSIIAVQALLAAPADGLTVFVSESTPITVNPKIFHHLPYRPDTDLKPVGTLAAYPFVIVVNNQAPYANLQDLVAAVKAKPGSVAMATVGNGTLDHIAGGLFAQTAGIDLPNVAYKGAAPALSDVMAGHVQAMFTDLPSGLPFIQSQKVKVLATAGAVRADQLANVPTAIESGFPDYTFSASFAVYAHGKTDSATAAALNQAINQAVRSQPMTEWLKGRNFTPFVSSLPEHKAYLDKQVALYSKILDGLNLPKN